MGRSTQYIAMVAGAIWVMTSGVNLGWSSPYLPVLQSEDSPVGMISSNDGFWCSVMPLVGAIPGALATGFLADKLGGRRNILVALTPIGFLCFLAIAFTKDLWVLDVARFILGSVEGSTYTVLPMYFGEIAEPMIRGTMSASILVGAVSGLLFINIIARFTSIFTSAIILSVIPLLQFFIFLWIPKSPYYLIKVGRLDEAKKSLQRLRNGDINEEYNDIIVAVKRQEASSSKGSWTDLFTVRSNRKAVMIFLIMASSTKFCGSNPIMFYTQTIFEEAGGILNPADSAILFHCIGLITAVFAAVLMDKFGRRPLVLVSVIGCAFSLATMATYLNLQYIGFDLSHVSWIPLVALICYYAIFNLGLCLGPVVYLSELFPTSVKGYALGMADSTSVFFGTVATKIFHGMTEEFGMHVAFWCFGMMCVLGTIMIYFVVPETKGKTLEEIQLELIGNRRQSVKSIPSVIHLDEVHIRRE